MNETVTYALQIQNYLIEFNGGTDDLVHWGGWHDTLTGVDRVFCGDGAETIIFHPGGAARIEKSFLYIEDFAQGTDKIDLVSGMSVAKFLSLGYDFNLSGTGGLRFDTAHGDTLFLAGFTAGQLIAGDFIV
ncbi:MAG: hypothetical protein KDK75_17870 [Alphaproteobacteria bacterium]|nr:hypothetical protein [Alphaproteobacteria bacterium]